MTRRVRFTFRSHPTFDTLMLPSSTYLQVAAVAASVLGSDYQIGRMTYVVNPQQRYMDEPLRMGTNWRLQATVLSPEPTIIAVDEYLRRPPDNLAVWLLSRPVFGAALAQLGAANQTRVAAEFFGAVVDEFLVSWESADYAGRDAILAALAAHMGMVPPDQLRYMPPEIFVSARRLDSLTQHSGLPAAAVVDAIMHPQPVGTLAADVRAIAYGERTMAAMATPQGRQLLHNYAHVALPPAPLPPGTVGAARRYGQ